MGEASAPAQERTQAARREPFAVNHRSIGIRKGSIPLGDTNADTVIMPMLVI
jgi:hypothetical protein